MHIEKIKEGIKKYLDCEIMPKLPFENNSWERVLVAVGINLKLNSMENLVGDYVPVIDGQVDIESLAKLVKENIQPDGMVFKTKSGIEMTFRKEDVDVLMRYIRSV